MPWVGCSSHGTLNILCYRLGNLIILVRPDVRDCLLCARCPPVCVGHLSSVCLSVVRLVLQLLVHHVAAHPWVYLPLVESVHVVVSEPGWDLHAERSAGDGEQRARQHHRHIRLGDAVACKVPQQCLAVPKTLVPRAVRPLDRGVDVGQRKLAWQPQHAQDLLRRRQSILQEPIRPAAREQPDAEVRCLPEEMLACVHPQLGHRTFWQEIRVRQAIMMLQEKSEAAIRDRVEHVPPHLPRKTSEPVRRAPRPPRMSRQDAGTAGVDAQPLHGGELF